MIGLSLSMMPGLVVNWGCMCRLRQVFQKKGSPKLETWQHLVLGGLSGASAALATTPLDLIKTRLQVGSAGSVRQAVALTVQEQGPKGLFAGLVRHSHLHCYFLLKRPCSVHHRSLGLVMRKRPSKGPVVLWWPV